MRQHSLAVFFLLFDLLAGGPVALAQSPPAPGPLAVDQVVERAVAENPELRALRADVDAARGRLRQAALRPNAMLDLGRQQNVGGPYNNLSHAQSTPLHLTGRKAGRQRAAARDIVVTKEHARRRQR